jgi:hypothetical protein
MQLNGISMLFINSFVVIAKVCCLYKMLYSYKRGSYDIIPKSPFFTLLLQRTNVRILSYSIGNSL